MLKSIETYYRKRGILSTNFKCAFKKECKRNCKTFTGPRSSFIGSEYIKNKFPRLLFLSLDSGSGSKNPMKRIPQVVKETIEKIVVSSLPKHKHWYRTHEIAFYILKRFLINIQISEVMKYFAQVNSAKCCMNKPNKEKADSILFKNCRKYLLGELKILKPNIIVTQGNEAKEFLLGYATTIKRFDKFSQIVSLNNREIFWLHTYHPNNWGSFNQQRKNGKGWEKYSKKIYAWYTKIV